MDVPGSTAREQRIAPRIKTFEPADLVGPDGRQRRVHLLNISATGALVHASDAPAPGTVVTVHAAFDLGRARVVWRNDRSFGIAFLAPISSLQLACISEAQRMLLERAARRAGMKRA